MLSPQAIFWRVLATSKMAKISQHKKGFGAHWRGADVLQTAQGRELGASHSKASW